MLGLKTGTIRARLLAGFVLIALLPLISAAAGSMIVGVINGRQQAYERLESVAASKELAIKRWVLPADWKIALLGVIGGVCVAVWGHTLDSRAYQSIAAKHRWIPWVVWPVISIVALFVIFLAVK